MDPNLNIYSEPLFPLSQGIFPSQSSSSLSSFGATQTLSGGSSGKGSSLGEDGGNEDVWVVSNEDSSEEEESENFKLETLATRAVDVRQRYLSTGCPHLDKSLRGGIPTFGVTEFYGESGVGKTQLCLQLAITAQLPKKSGGLNSGVVYICTEDAFPSKRLVELIANFRKKFPELDEDIMGNIFIEHVSEAEALMQCINVRLASLARDASNNIRLVIIDSIAAIFRSEFDDIRKRNKELRQLAQALHEFSSDYRAAIVVCNQVSSVPSADGNVASLGMTWRNLVTTRIRLAKSEDISVKHRSIYVDFSPHIPSILIPYHVFAGGVHGEAPMELPQRERTVIINQRE